MNVKTKKYNSEPGTDSEIEELDIGLLTTKDLSEMDFLEGMTDSASGRVAENFNSSSAVFMAESELQLLKSYIFPPIENDSFSIFKCPESSLVLISNRKESESAN